MFFLISAQNIACGYSLEPPTINVLSRKKKKKKKKKKKNRIPEFLFENVQFFLFFFFLCVCFFFFFFFFFFRLVVKFSIYLNRRVFVIRLVSPESVSNPLKYSDKNLHKDNALTDLNIQLHVV